MDSFFPFDPYLLRHSYPFIEPFYNEWEALPDEAFTEDERRDADDTSDEEDEEVMRIG